MYHVQKNIKTLLFLYYSNYLKRRKSRRKTYSLRETFEFNKFENRAEKSFFVQD